MLLFDRREISSGSTWGVEPTLAGPLSCFSCTALRHASRYVLTSAYMRADKVQVVNQYSRDSQSLSLIPFMGLFRGGERRRKKDALYAHARSDWI